MVEARVVPVPVPMPVFVQMPIDMNHSQIKQEVASDSTSKPAIPSKEVCSSTFGNLSSQSRLGINRMYLWN